jgi:hypothetical protein
MILTVVAVEVEVFPVDQVWVVQELRHMALLDLIAHPPVKRSILWSESQ